MMRTQTKSCTAVAERRDDIVHVLILVFIASVLGAYLIAATILISKDGVTYITVAGKFSSEPLNVIKGLIPGFPKGLAFGYPLSIFAAHKVAAWLGADSSAVGWTYSAQVVTLLCRVLALIPLYFIGKLLAGAKRSFWAVAILVVLPYPAQYGSDALRDWPHVLFLATGLLLLLRGAKDCKWWLFAGAGLAAGLGQLIRPECVQLVAYGILWLLIRLIVPKAGIGRGRLAGALAALLLGFAIPAAPYMSVRGQVLPQKLEDYISAPTLKRSEARFEPAMDRNIAPAASIFSGQTASAAGELAVEISSSLMYYFVPALVVGVYARVRRRSQATDVERFFVPAFIFANVLMMIMLYCHWGYMSRRHCLPLVVMLTFYVPQGLEILAQWLEQRLTKNRVQSDPPSQRWFFVLLAIGAAICIPKLLSRPGYDKQGYREAAEWLRQNTQSQDVIAVPDRRISLYAERKGVLYSAKIPKGIDYLVRIEEQQDQQKAAGEFGRRLFSVKVEKRARNKKQVAIYRVS